MLNNMNTKTKIFLFCLSALLFNACTDLDTYPEGTVTSDQEKELLKEDPEYMRAKINALCLDLIAFDLLGDENHFDYGYPAACLMFESCGQDMTSPFVGYNWFRAAASFSDRNYASDEVYFLWRLFYKNIRTANDILELIPTDTTDPDFKVYRGQALAFRAFDYLHLVQMFQFTYDGHQDKPGVPIVTENMTVNEVNNNPRATVSEVYKLIMDDLDEAIVLLEDYLRPGKNYIDQSVAYGLRARANLLMKNGAAAVSDAENALEGGYHPYKLEDVSRPSFNNADSDSWLWGCIISELNEAVQTGIINWPSHLCSFTGNGYTTLTYTYRRINKLLWLDIPESDVRKGWWVDENYMSPLIDDVMLEDMPVSDYFYLSSYANVKFGAYQNVYGNTVNASDWPLMRAEEMLLIMAEGYALSGDIFMGKQVLEEFVREYRDPEFTSIASNETELIDEIWFQRRIELWGEGFAFFDLLRLKKPMVRYEGSISNFPASLIFNLEPEEKIMLWRIPEKEINTNHGIPPSANNEVVPIPTPVVLN